MSEEPKDYYIENLSKNDLLIPIMGQEFKDVIRKEVVEGHLLEVEAKEAYAAPVQTILIPGSMTRDDIPDTRRFFSKSQIKALREHSTFQLAEKERWIAVHRADQEG